MNGAGTDADVHVILQGAKGSVQSYFITSSRDLGDIASATIWHKNNGSGPGWHLGWIKVTDKQTGGSLTWNCNRWLATDEDDGKIQRKVRASGCR
ncbi:MAG: PLAT/LH2 domain-containing protein [Spirochaetes bacterium]|nr:PLAT/LH2 domain-containing protein [Spirochaetota bacterium]